MQLMAQPHHSYRHAPHRIVTTTPHLTLTSRALASSGAMPVQQHVLNWLYSILTSVRPSSCRTATNRQEYHDVNRTYNDVAQALTSYPSLSPRTDVHSTWPSHSAPC